MSFEFPQSLRWSAVLAVGLAAVPATAQDAADAGPPPSVAEALAFVNTELADNPSPWRPCRSVAQLELAEDGTLTAVVRRGGYCEDSRMLASIRDLDASAISFEVADEIVLRVPCLEEDTCARHAQIRKTRASGTWEPRDADWIPDGPAEQEHRVPALELPMSSRPEKAARVASALQYLVKAAAVDPAYAEPVDRFAQAPPPAPADGT